MPTFNKYQLRSPHYHWRQISRNIFRFNAYVAARYQQVVNLIPQKSQQKILDIGCGDGVLLSLISQKTKSRLFGLDFDQASLDYAKTKVKAKFIQGSAGKIPFKNNLFDLILATEIIEHLSRPELMLQEISRVLKKGGRAIITMPVKQEQGLTDPLHCREYDPEELKQLCRDYFNKAVVKTSHPAWLKKIYTYSFGRIGRYHLDAGRWLINLVVLSSGWNPFINLSGKPTQQLALCQK